MQDRRDIFPLLSLLLVILLYPLLNHDDVQRLVLGGLMFGPLLLATVKMAQIEGWLWPAILLMTRAVVSAIASTFFPSPTVVGLKWGILAAFFGLCASSLFSYLRTAHTLSAMGISTRQSAFTRFSDCSGSPFIAPSTSSVLVPSSTIWVVVERIGESLFG